VASRKLSNSNILRRLIGLTSFAGFSLFSLSIFFANHRLESERRSQAQLLLSAIEAGPVNFARLHSPEIAKSQVQGLFNLANSGQPVFQSLRILSGPNFSEELVSFNRHAESTIGLGCFITIARETRFQDGFYPFKTELIFDQCVSFQESLRTHISFLLFSSLAIIAVIFSISVALQPIKSSIDFAMESLAIDSPGSIKGISDNIRYTPVARLVSAYVASLELKRDAAIARTTQMLAHDVRKPFALFRMTLDRVKSAGSSEQVQQALQEALPEVERSLANVNGLISDVLNVGGEFNLVLKPVRLAPVVEDVIDELRKLHPTRTLSVQVSVPSDVWVEADDTRLPRVFLNILSNSIEAVETKEVQLWVLASALEQSSNSKGRQIEVRVGNTGSYIAPEARSKLFDLFYTSGKKGGTGLGLAIVRKIIEAHGSSVVCSSERSELAPQGKVEFTWNLAAAVGPQNSSESTHPESSDSDIKAPTIPEVATLPTVAFLDDSPLARWVWEAKLKTKAKVISFASPVDFWTAVESNGIELQSLHTIITDHYFAPEEKITGVEFAAHVRQRGFTGRILLASNGEFDSEKLAGIVDKIVDKQPAEWDVLNS